MSDTLPRLENICEFRFSLFISDPCNVMVKVRKLLVEEKKVYWAYGCVAQTLNNFCKYLGKESFGKML